MPSSSLSPSRKHLDDRKKQALLNETSVAHHIKGIRPALSVMENMGYTANECLKGSGISLADLEQSDQGISLQQEFAFYRRLLDLSQDPLLGLKLGKAYRLENYGILGYAILSAKTLGEALKIAKDFSPLSFSHFELDFALEGNMASIIMRHNKILDSSLMTFYEDRDCSAIIHGSASALGKPFPLSGIDLMHPEPLNIKEYEHNFQCPIRFNRDQMSIHFSIEVLSMPMPLRDPETSEYCRLQCQLLLEKISHQRSLSDHIKTVLKSENNGFPTLAELSQSLQIPERTVRRKLLDEGYKFQDILNEARFERAKSLLRTNLNLSEISQQLGYSEAGNFSHAFRRWSGMSPKAYRDDLLE